MQETRGLADVYVSREENYPQFDIIVDREKAAAAGLSQRDIAQAALFSLNSNVSVNPAVFTDPRTGNQYNIVVQLDEPFRPAPEDLSRLFVVGDGGRPILLGNVRQISAGHRSGHDRAQVPAAHRQVTANAAGRDLGSLSRDLEEQFKPLPLPPGFTLQLGGQTQQQREAFGSLYFTAMLALLLVYMVMASQFKSLMDPFIIMFSVPMGLIGVFWALFLTNTTLSVTSFMGIIMMVGIVVSNGVLLVEYINELRRHGLGRARGRLRAGRTRLRPILMTSSPPSSASSRWRSASAWAPRRICRWRAR